MPRDSPSWIARPANAAPRDPGSAPNSETRARKTDTYSGRAAKYSSVKGPGSAVEYDDMRASESRTVRGANAPLNELPRYAFLPLVPRLSASAPSRVAQPSH